MSSAKLPTDIDLVESRRIGGKCNKKEKKIGQHLNFANPFAVACLLEFSLCSLQTTSFSLS